jgi:hypothetical protein
MTHRGICWGEAVLRIRIRRIRMFLGLLDLDPLVCWGEAVLRIRIRRIRMFLGLLDLDPLVTGTNPDPSPSIIEQK